MRHCDSLTVLSPHFVSFAWRYLGVSAFRPRAAPDTKAHGSSRSLFDRSLHLRFSFKELPGSPKFPGNPRDHSPCSPTPARPSPRLGPMVRGPGMAPASNQDGGSPHLPISGLNRTAFGLAVYASQWSVAAPPRKTRFWWLVPALPGGIRTRRVPTKGFRIVRFFLPSRASWRKVRSVVLPRPAPGSLRSSPETRAGFVR
jgi:hypothetical protein